MTGATGVTGAKSEEGDPRDGALVTPHWQLDDTAATAPRRVLRGLPSATWPVLAMIRQAAPVPALAVAVMQVVSGLAAAFGLFATTGVLTELLASGPTTERVLAALPNLLLVGAAFGLRGAMDVGVSLAHARITPAVRRLAEERLYAASLTADLAAFDDSRFHDRMHRARDRGLFYLERAADNLVELLGAVLGIVAATGSLAVLHPILVPVLLLAVIPDGWAVQRARSSPTPASAGPWRWTGGCRWWPVSPPNVSLPPRSAPTRRNRSCCTSTGWRRTRCGTRTSGSPPRRPGCAEPAVRSPGSVSR